MTQHLTDAVIRRLPTPEKNSKITYDTVVKGFGVSVTRTGHKAFILNYWIRGRERRITIGDAAVWRCTDARDKAKRLRREIDDGTDPLADLQAEREAETVNDLCDRFEADHLSKKRASTQGDYRRMLTNHIRPALGGLKVAAIDYSDIDRLHRKITNSGSPYAANRCIAVLSKAFSLAVRWKMRPDNPCKGIERNTEYERRRYLDQDELVRLLQALAQHPDRQAANIIRLLLLTGARRWEVFSMRWEDVDLGAGTWSKLPSSTKQKAHHTSHLSAPARQLLSEIEAEQLKSKRTLPTYVFPSSSSERGHIVDVKHSWSSICKVAGISALRLHDLRHSYASHLVSGGASLALVGAMLGHSNPRTTARYAHLFADPQKEAAERVGAVIMNAGKPAVEPTPLKGRRS